MDAERAKAESDRTERVRELTERQAQEIESFDTETQRLGMSATEIAQASSLDSPYDDEVASLRGSMISLTPSSSSSSFSSQAYNNS